MIGGRVDKIEFSPGFEYKAAIGVDEVNFSPSIAGDCVVCAAWLPLDDPITGVDDSKKLTPKRRLGVFGEIIKKAIYTIIPASPSDIKWFGIYEARNLAAHLAVQSVWEKLLKRGIHPQDTHVICDNSLKKALPFAQHVLHADQRSYVVGAASIIAKVYLDALFEGWGKFWPEFGMESDHGSPSKRHEKALREIGPSPVHRTENYAKEWWRRIMYVKYPEGEENDEVGCCATGKP